MDETPDKAELVSPKTYLRKALGAPKKRIHDAVKVEKQNLI